MSAQCDVNHAPASNKDLLISVNVCHAGIWSGSQFARKISKACRRTKWDHFISSSQGSRSHKAKGQGQAETSVYQWWIGPRSRITIPSGLSALSQQNAQKNIWRNPQLHQKTCAQLGWSDLRPMTYGNVINVFPHAGPALPVDWSGWGRVHSSKRVCWSGMGGGQRYD